MKVGTSKDDLIEEYEKTIKFLKEEIITKNKIIEEKEKNELEHELKIKEIKAKYDEILNLDSEKDNKMIFTKEQAFKEYPAFKVCNEKVLELLDSLHNFNISVNERRFSFINESKEKMGIIKNELTVVKEMFLNSFEKFKSEINTLKYENADCTEIENKSRDFCLCFNTLKSIEAGMIVWEEKWKNCMESEKGYKWSKIRAIM